MKLATYQDAEGSRIGAITPDGCGIVDLRAAAGDGSEVILSSMLALIEGGEKALDRARELADRAVGRGDHLRPLGETRLLAPVPVPPQLRDFSVFPGHVRAAPVGMQKLVAQLHGNPAPDISPAAEIPPVYRQQPIYYITNRFSVIGPDETVKWPAYSQYMDFELELAAILWKGGKDISRADAAEHIFGYTIYNDFSARDTQINEMEGMLGPTKGKSFDMGNAMGPWIVTRDEIPDIRALNASVRINGETFMNGDCSDMLHDFEDMIAYVSRDETLHAGEIFGSGTLGGGCGLEHFRFLQDGDEVELQFEGIGRMKHKVVRQV